MKRHQALLTRSLCLFIWCLVLAAPARSGHGGRYIISPYNMKVWKPFDEIGKVAQVLVENPGCGKYYNFEVVLQDEDQKNVIVHLGPVWYMERRGFNLFPGDVTEVKGVLKTAKEGKLSVVAYEIIKGDEVLVLRDSEGWPVWPGAGHPIWPRTKL
jgi:hypothetical protein